MTHKHVTLIVGQVLDGLTLVLVTLLVPSTFLLIERGGPTGFLLLNVGVLGYLAVKIGLPLLVAHPRLHQYQSRRRVRAMMIVAGYSGFIGACFNAYAIGQVAGLMGLI
jgi:hypothetical protein